MNGTKTTLAGLIAAIATLFAGLPSSPSTLHTIAVLITALALVALGWHATDCPANCPGTDAAGRRKLLPALVSLAMAAAALLALALICSSCAYMRARTTRSTDTPGQEPSETTTLTAYTLLDSGQVLAKARANSGYATNGQYSPGIALSGVNQYSSSTNLDELISAVASGVVSGLTAGGSLYVKSASALTYTAATAATAAAVHTLAATNAPPPAQVQTTNAAPDLRALVAEIVARVLAGLTNTPPPPQK